MASCQAERSRLAQMCDTFEPETIKVEDSQYATKLSLRKGRNQSSTWSLDMMVTKMLESHTVLVLTSKVPFEALPQLQSTQK